MQSARSLAYKVGLSYGPANCKSYDMQLRYCVISVLRLSFAFSTKFLFSSRSCSKPEPVVHLFLCSVFVLCLTLSMSGTLGIA